MQHYFVTAENIDDVREEITALDQRAEIEVGCETWSIRSPATETPNA